MRKLTKEEVSKINKGHDEVVDNFRKYLPMELLAEAKEKMYEASVLMNKCESLMEFGFHEEWFRDVELLLARVWSTALEEFESELDDLHEQAKSLSGEAEIDKIIEGIMKMSNESGFSVLGGVVKLNKNETND